MLRAYEQATGRIDPLEDALAFPGAVLDCDLFAQAKGVIEPGDANALERLSGAPSAERFAEALDDTRNQLARVHSLSPSPRETRGCIPDALWRMRAIHADPDHAGGPPPPEANAFDEDPRAFRASTHEIVRPFEANVSRSKIPRGARQGHARDEAELRRDRRGTGIDHEAAGVQVTARREPDPATAAPAGGLLVRDNPHAAGVAGQRAATRLFVGRIDGAQSNDAPVMMRAVRSGDGVQKSDCAAAMAALVSGEGANTNRMIMSAESASTMRATGVGRSNAGAGSSKYISLTILR